MAKDVKPAAADAPAKPSLLARLKGIRNLPEWVRAHRIKAALMFSAVFSVLGAALFTWAVLSAQARQRAKEEAYTCADAFAALDEGDLPKALHIAQIVQKSGKVTTDDAGGPAYIFGVAALRRADTPIEWQQRRSHQVAAHWFHEAHRLGLPHGREAEGLYLTGKSLFLAGRYAEAAPILREAIGVRSEHAAELRHYAARAWALKAEPDLAASLREYDDYLTDKSLSADQRDAAQIERAEVLLRLGRTADARRDLTTAGSDESRKIQSRVLEARILIHESGLIARETLEARVAPRQKADDAAGEKDRDPADQPASDAVAVQPAPPTALAVSEADAADGRAKLTRALELLEAASRIERHSTPYLPQIWFVKGQALAALGRDDEAAEMFAQVARRAMEMPVGLAARLESADLLRRRDRPDPAVEQYGDTLAELGPLNRYGNPWLSLPDLRTRLLIAYQYFTKHKQYSAAANLADLMSKVLEADLAAQLAAEAHVAWARQLSQGPDGTPRDERHPPQPVRDQYCTAAKLYDRLAELRFTSRDYAEQIWLSARYYLAGRDYDGAARQFRRYLDIEPRVHHAQALVGLAEVMLTKERYAECLALLKSCLESYPRDPAVFQARLVLSDLYGEMNEPEAAERALLDNLDSEALTPDGAEWRRSLFALSRMLYDRGRYDEAADRLDEAVERYPDDPDAVVARYCAAEAHRRIAERIESQIPPGALPTERAKFLRLAAEEFQEALDQFDRTIQAARTPVAGNEDDAGRTALLRNALFGRGAVLCSLERYDEAIRAYQTAVAAFPQSPAVLDAYLQMAECHRRMNRAPEVRGTLEQAKLMLNRIPNDVSFESVSNYTRDEWSRLLETLGSL